MDTTITKNNFTTIRMLLEMDPNCVLEHTDELYSEALQWPKMAWENGFYLDHKADLNYMFYLSPIFLGESNVQLDITNSSPAQRVTLFNKSSAVINFDPGDNKSRTLTIFLYDQTEAYIDAPNCGIIEINIMSPFASATVKANEKCTIKRDAIHERLKRHVRVKRI